MKWKNQMKAAMHNGIALTVIAGGLGTMGLAIYSLGADIAVRYASKQDEKITFDSNL